MLRKRFIALAAFLLLVAASGMLSASSTNSYCVGGANPGIIQGAAPWYCTQADQAIASQWSTWEPIAVIAILFSFTLATILFIAAQILNNGKIRNFAIGEYYEAIATTIIVAGFLFLTAVMVGLIPSLIIGTNPYVSSLNYVSNTINSTQNMLTELFNIAVADKQLMTTHIAVCTGFNSGGASTGAAQIGAPPTPELPNIAASGIASQSAASGASSSLPIYSGAAQIGSVSGTQWCSDDIADYLEPAITVFFYIPAMAYISLQSDAIALLYGEFYMIMIFMYAAIPVFLIPGIILRSILPLRGLGGMMIAIAIGTYIIMPTLFSVAYYFTNQSMTQQLLGVTSALASYGNGPGAQLNAVSPQSPLPQELNLLRQGLGSYWMSVLFYPVLIFAITYAMIVQIAQFLGNMTSMSGKFKII
jgi:hypothetical protein